MSPLLTIAQSWPLEVGVIAGLLLFLRLGRRVRRRRADVPAAPRRREKGKAVAARGRAEYDLARDESTDGQRWLM